MYRKSFVKRTISSLNPNRFKRLRDILNNEKYIPFDFVEHEKIDRRILEEKVSDYFEKVELMSNIKRFDSLIEKYAADLDSVVRGYIDTSTRSSKNGKQVVTRAKRYYDKAYAMKRTGLKSFDMMLDYSRIMLCLYMAIINKNHGYISDFNYSADGLDGNKIIESLRNEVTSNLWVEERKFDTRGAYSLDRCTFIIMTIMYQYIKSMEIKEEK